MRGFVLETIVDISKKGRQRPSDEDEQIRHELERLKEGENCSFVHLFYLQHIFQPLTEPSELKHLKKVEEKWEYDQRYC